MRALAALFTALLAIAVAGCGGEDATGTQSFEAAVRVAQAGRASADAESAKVSFRAEFTGDTTGSMSGEGVFSKRQGHLIMDLRDLGGTGSALGEAEIVFDKLVYYLKVPEGSGVPLPPGKTWFKLDLAKLGETQGLDLAQLTQLNQSDPSQALDFLAGASSDFHEVGSDEVRGEPTTHYAGTIDLDKVADNAPDDVAEQYRKLAELSPTKTIPLDVWIGSDGLVRKIRFEQAPAEGSTMTIEEELYDYGTSADVTIPPQSEVTDVTELLGFS
jgi:hypothetical protein